VPFAVPSRTYSYPGDVPYVGASKVRPMIEPGGYRDGLGRTQSDAEGDGPGGFRAKVEGGVEPVAPDPGPSLAARPLQVG
jgi:hypothetical protein